MSRIDCKTCDGHGTVYGPYKGIAGCETEEFECPDCEGSGLVLAECVWCGEDVIGEGSYCSDACRLEDEAAAAGDVREDLDDDMAELLADRPSHATEL